jgi:hypothetical protein
MELLLLYHSDGRLQWQIWGFRAGHAGNSKKIHEYISLLLLSSQHEWLPTHLVFSNL